MNEWPRAIHVYFCLDDSLLLTSIQLFMRYGPRGALWKCTRPPGGKITWALFAKGLTAWRLYTFNTPMALFSETNTEVWDRRHTVPFKTALFFLQSFISPYLNICQMWCWAQSNPIVTRTVPGRTSSANGREIIITGNTFECSAPELHQTSKESCQTVGIIPTVLRMRNLQ